MSIKQKKHSDFQSSIVTFYPPLKTDDPVYEMIDRRARATWEQTRNPLYVMDAFFRRFADMTVDRECDLDSSVSFPYWMAKPVAEWFEVYYSNLILKGNSRTTLDNCARINKSHKKEFNPFVITADQVVNEAYNLMWLFEIGRTEAIELAFEFLSKAAEIDEGVGNDPEKLFSFAVSADTVIQYADRGGMIKRYVEWLEENGHIWRWVDEEGNPQLDEKGNAYDDTVYKPSDSEKETYFEYIGAVSEDIQNRLKEKMSNSAETVTQYADRGVIIKSFDEWLEENGRIRSVKAKETYLAYVRLIENE